MQLQGTHPRESSTLRLGFCKRHRSLASPSHAAPVDFADGSLHARRQALGYIYDKQLVHALFEAAPERYADRNGGYTRVLSDGFRRGDNAAMSTIELL